MKKYLILTVSACLFLASCATVPKEVPQELSYPEIIQMGQTEFDGGRYAAALVYFNTAVDRYGEDLSKYVEARYETGHLYIRQKKYDEAEPVLREIIEIYKSSTPGSIPAAYQKLAELELAKIPVKGSKN